MTVFTMKRSTLLVLVCVIGVANLANGNIISHGTDKCANHCLPGNSCWPTNVEMWNFMTSLDGDLLFPTSPEYSKYVTNHNTVTTAFPELVALVISTEDVQRSVLFANKYNIRITIRSSGHDYNGRDTWDGSLMINFQNFTDMNGKNVSARAPEGEITIGSGQSWINVYNTLTPYGRVIVGGSAHTVSMGGYTLGGGHSPIGRMFGLAIDNLLEAKLVTKDGKIVISTPDETKIQDENGVMTGVDNGELFWALRGGGGGTFGIVTEFTYKVHQEPMSMVRCSISYPVINKAGTNVGKTVLRLFSDMLVTLPREWGGYVIWNSLPNDHGLGTLSFFLNHFGGWDTDTRRVMDKLYNFEPTEQMSREYKNHSKFIDYENTALDAPFYQTYIFNILVANMTDNWIDETMSILFSFPLNQSAVFFTGTLIGGKMHEVSDDATAIHPGFRHSYISLSGGVSWSDPAFGDILRAEGEKLNARLRKHGYGMYRNEASPLPGSWEDDYWGSNFPRLVQIKHSWDPDNVLCCFDCVQYNQTRFGLN